MTPGRRGALPTGSSTSHEIAAPGWGDIAAWWNEPGSKDPTLIDNDAFLDTILPDDDVPEVSRANATLGFRSGR